MRWALSGCVEYGCDQELDVAVVETGESVLEVDGDPVSQACCDLQHRCSPPEQGRLAPRAVIAAGQVILAHRRLGVALHLGQGGLADIFSELPAVLVTC